MTPAYSAYLALIPRGIRERRTLLAAAREAGCTHLLLFRKAEESALLAASQDHADALILATRAHSGSRIYARLSHLLLRLESGVRVRETRAEAMAFPLRLLEIAPCRWAGEAWPVELVARAAWAGCEVIEIPAAGAGTPDADSFRAFPMRDAADVPPAPNIADCPVRTGMRRFIAACAELALHARLLTRRLSGWPHPRFHPAADRAQHPPFWSEFWHWLNPMRAWRELRAGGANRNEMAAGIALGVFIANLPAYGIQTVLALYAARRLHLHPVSVVAGSKISTPPIGPLMIGAAIWVGHVVLHGSRLTWTSFNPTSSRFWTALGPLLLDWTFGSLLIGIVMALAAFFAANYCFRSLERQPAAPMARAGRP